MSPGLLAHSGTAAIRPCRPCPAHEGPTRPGPWGDGPPAEKKHNPKGIRLPARPQGLNLQALLWKRRIDGAEGSRPRPTPRRPEKKPPAAPNSFDESSGKCHGPSRAEPDGAGGRDLQEILLTARPGRDLLIR